MVCHAIFASCFLNLANNYRGTNVVITSYSNVNPNIVTTFLRVHKKTSTQRQYQRDINVRRTFIQRLYNVIVLAGNHALNRDDGAYLPEEYIHLIGR
jgi:deoxyhypusine synthase